MNALAEQMKRISLQDVEKRSERIRSMIDKEFNIFLQSFQDKLDQFQTRKKTRYACYQETLRQDFQKFQKAGENIVTVFIPILRNDIVMQTLAQEDILQHLKCLKEHFDKTWDLLVRRLMRQEDSLQEDDDVEGSPWVGNRQKPIRKAKIEDRRKAKNCKIPAVNSHLLQKWLIDNFGQPYPSKNSKLLLAQQSGLTLTQVNNWFINARQRVVKKYVVRRKLKKLRKEADSKSQADS